MGSLSKHKGIIIVIFAQLFLPVLMMNEEENLLFNISSPEDLRKLKPADMPKVSAELRQYIIEMVSKNPGHLGASLGVVELTVALHYVFNTPYDKMIWDVGHQAYGHKILTGQKGKILHKQKI